MWASFVEEWLAHAVLGCSMGGQICLELALRHLGHFPMAEHPQAFLARLKPLLAAVPAR
jgi:pimeloyl-ACP methyl ester carboxylesterase